MSVTTEEVLGDPVGRESRGAYSSQSEAAESPFEVIFTQHYARVVAVLVRLLGDRAQAEELADDVFWKLYRRPLPPDRDHNLAGWLYRTATRMGIDALRAIARRQRYEQEAAPNTFGRAAALDPLDEVLRHEQRRQVRETLARLKPDHAQLLILRYSGFSYQELAEAVGVKSSSIGPLLARAEAEFERRYRQIHKNKE